MPTNDTGDGGAGEADERRFRVLVESLFEGLVVCEAIRDPGGRVVDYWLRYVNPVFARRAPPGEAQVGRRMLEMRPAVRQPWFEACERALAGEHVRFEFQESRTGRWYEVHMVRISETEFTQLFVDLTSRKAAERRQADLLRELNHRVKNNLAVVSAMLDLQGRAASPEVREHLGRAVDRVQSIALLHELLYRQDGADHVDLAAYLSQLGANLDRSILSPMHVRLAISCEPLQCPVRVAVNLGLILNELVTNAAKYAYGPDGGLVEVSAAMADERLRLVVADHGPGLPQGALAAARGLGLRLVRSLTESLGGQVSAGEGPGTRIEVSVAFASPEAPAAAQQRLL